MSSALAGRFACIAVGLLLAAASPPVAVLAQDGAAQPAAQGPAAADGLVRAAVAAFERKSERPFEALVAAIDADFAIDPWIVADELAAAGKPEAAAAFALAGAGPRWSGLDSYIKGADAAKPRPAERTLHAAVADAGGRHDAARVLALTDQSATASAPPTVLALDVWCRRADALFAAGRGAEAVKVAHAAADAARSIGWLAGELAASSAEGRGAQNPFDATVLLAAYSRAAETAIHVGHFAEAGRALNNVAVAHGMAGDFAASLGAMERASAAYDRAPAAAVATRDRVILLMNLGEARAQIGEAAGARIALDRAIGLLRSIPAAEATADLAPMLRRTLASLCNARMLTGDASGALKTLTELAGMAQAAADADGLAGAAALEGKIRSETGEWDLALTAFRTAAARFASLSNETFRLRAVAAQGYCLRELGRTQEAAALLQPTIEALIAGRDTATLPNARRELGQALAALGRSDEALSLLRTSLDGAVELGQRDDAVRTRVALAETLLLAGDAAGALAAATAAADDVPGLVRDTAQTDAPQTRRRWARCYDVGLRAALALADTDAALRFLEAGRAGALIEGLRGRDFATAAADPALLRELHLARRERACAELALGEAVLNDVGLKEVAARRAALARAGKVERDLTERLQRESRAAARLAYPAPVEAAAARADLAPNEAVVIYRALPGESVAAVLTRAEARLVRLAGTVSWSADAARLGTPAGKGSVDLDGAASRLRDALVAPLRLPAEATRVLVSPDGALSVLPLCLLFPDRSVGLVPSATALHEIRSRPRAGGLAVLAVGDPDYTLEPKLAPLPGTRAEVESIPGPKVALLRREATPQHFAAALGGGGPWRAVHLACHGLPDGSDPWSSAVALSATKAAGGRLTALEMVAMPFRADIVTLSACELAGGRAVEAEGAVGVPQALLVAGARCVLASLWRADDEAAQLLMKTFYEEWRDGGSGAAEALRVAQARVREDPRWKGPQFWAGWTLWGSPD